MFKKRIFLCFILLIIIMIAGCSIIPPTPVTHTITIISGDNGSVTPEGETSVTAGGNLSLSITADDGYVIADILIDGESILTEGEVAGKIYTYTFINIQENHTIEVIFKKETVPPFHPSVVKTYTVRFLDWDNTVLKTQSVKHGDPAIAPDEPTREGYNFIGWDPDDFSNITSDLDVIAQYEQITFELYISIGGDGSGSTDPEELVYHTYAYGTDVDITAVPANECSYFEKWSGDVDSNDIAITVTMYSNLNLTAHFSKRVVYNINQNKNYLSIQGAIDDANQNDEIVVCPGTYTENINYKGKNIILRSIDPTDTTVVVSTVIDGDSNGSVVTFNSNETSAAVLSGFTIRNGYIEGDGGGIYIYNCSPLITKNIIEDNYASFGGGIYLGESDANITDNIIRNNDVSSDGGGINVFLGSPTITNNQIYGNNAGYGIYVYDATPTIGGVDSEDTDNFNTIKDNSPDQIYPDSYPYNYFS